MRLGIVNGTATNGTMLEDGVGSALDRRGTALRHVADGRTRSVGMNAADESRRARRGLYLSRDLGSRIIDGFQDPVLVIDRHRTLLFLNRAAKRVLALKAGFVAKDGKLFVETKADAELRRALAESHEKGGKWRCRGIRVNRPRASQPWLMLVHSLHEAARARHGERTFILQLIDRTRPRAIPYGALRDLFGLTERETAVVAELVRSTAARAAARRLSLSEETVRNHLKGIFRKCEVHSKAELLSLLHACAQFGALADERPDEA